MLAKLIVSGRVLIALIMFLFFVVMVGIALTYPTQARFMPLVVGIPGIAFTLLELVKEIRRVMTTTGAVEAPTGGAGAITLPGDVSRLIGQESLAIPAEAPQMTPAKARKRERILLAYYSALMLALILLGFWISVPVFVATFLREREKISWAKSLLGAAIVLAILYFVFYRGLGIDLHSGFITDWAWEQLFPPE